MLAHRKQKMAIVMFIILGSAAAIGLVLFALEEGINLFYTPTEVSAGKVSQGENFRIGGMVKVDSLVTEGLDGTQIEFITTDFCNDVPVAYDGVLPDLFREGQGVTADGYMDEQGVFQATQILAMHDENYMSVEVKAAMDAAEQHDLEVCVE